MIRDKKFVTVIIALYLIVSAFFLTFFLFIAPFSLYNIMVSVIVVILIAWGILYTLDGGGY